jgi:hypothetical protein
VEAFWRISLSHFISKIHIRIDLILNPSSFAWCSGIVITNDGNAILREIDVSHPAAKVCHSQFVSSMQNQYLDAESMRKSSTATVLG